MTAFPAEAAGRPEPSSPAPLPGGHAPLSADEARSLTDEVKQDAERLWRKLVELYEGRAHEALGYTSWGDYFEAEFGGSRAKGYRLLDAGRVVDALSRQLETETVSNEAQARELAPLLNSPPEMAEAWEESQERAAEQSKPVTAAIVREVVKEKQAAKERSPFFTDELDLAEHFFSAWHAISHAAAKEHRDLWAQLPDDTRTSAITAIDAVTDSLAEVRALLEREKR